jgi:uncharacterized tellurite resistance protein B-like protein
MKRELSPVERMRLMKFVCSFVWADLKVADKERAHVKKLIAKLGLEPSEAKQVEQWLKVPPHPEEVDPTRIPAEHRQIFLKTLDEVIGVDGERSEEEKELLALLEELLG